MHVCYVDDMCLYTHALFGTNLFSVTTAKVGLIQIRTRCLINERVFCLKGSVFNHIYWRCCLCHYMWPRTLHTLGLNLQQKPPHSVWLETMVYLQPCFALQQPVLLMASRTTMSISDLHRQWLKGHGSTSACGCRRRDAASRHISSQEMMRACQEHLAHQGTLTWGLSVTSWG